MRAACCSILILFAVAATIAADEATCPASRAADQGFVPFEAFHEVMAPAWHQAWPARDFEALYAAGPEFSRLFKHIAMLKPAFKTSSRRAIFLQRRQEFAQLVKDYQAACLARDSNLVYGLMPPLHEAFEATASALLPVYYPEFDGFVITLNVIMETHLPANNVEGLIGSTETLAMKADGLTRENVPEDLVAVADEVVGWFDRFREKVASMSAALADSDLAVYKQTAGELQILVSEFIAKFI